MFEFKSYNKALSRVHSVLRKTAPQCILLRLQAQNYSELRLPIAAANP